jgi:hypothetical protein
MLVLQLSAVASIATNVIYTTAGSDESPHPS